MSMLPKKAHQYPLYIFIYWVIAWAIVMLYFVLAMVSSGSVSALELKNTLVITGISAGTCVMAVGYPLMFLKSSKKKKQKL